MTTSTGILRREANPVLVKELRGRFRGPRAFAALTAFLIALAGMAFLLYQSMVDSYAYMSSGPYYGPGPEAASNLGQGIFTAIAVLEMLFIAFIGPALTMSAISGEVERQTYELLLATPLSAWSIVRGKAAAALAYVALLILAAIPVMSLAFLFGGVTATSVVQVQLSVLVGGLVFIAIGLFFSSVFKRTVRAAMASYLAVGLLSIAPIIVIYVVLALTSWTGTTGSELWMAMAFQLSPFAPLMAIVMDTNFGVSGMDSGLFWAQALLLQTVIAAVLILVAVARIRRVGRQAAASAFAIVVALLVWAAWVSVDQALSSMFP